MWLLSHDGDLTGGKRLWLRPGTSHLLGRSHDSGSDFSIYVDAKTVSRKHLVLTVRDVPPGAARRLDARSEVVLRDSSKFGTVLDGERFTDAEMVVGGEGDEREVHVVGLGKWDVAWRLTWHPVVITTSGRKKSRKKDGDVVDIVDKLEPLDIKVVPDYMSEITTHVVSAKRNTPRALQALINGSKVQFDQLGPVVMQGTGKALVKAIEPGSEDVDGFVQYVKNVTREDKAVIVEEKDINVIQLAKERREKEEEERRKDEESLREAMKDLDVESMKNLAKVEEMEIRPRSERTGDAEEQDGDERWKTEWNGRKNFKKFRKRRAGDQDGESQAPLRSRKVIVALEEVKRDEITLDDDDDSFLDEIAFNSGRSRLGSRHGDSQTSSHHADRTARGTSRLPPSERADSDDDAVFTRTGAGRRSASASQGSGPAKAISLRPGADAELHDLDPAEIAGQPRSESIAAARDAQRPGTASSTRSKATSVAPGSASMAC
ncbi:putative dna damage response protein [Neofusicoccum parvum UCRNP2]|uniref:Putative dna damage response protein n=1 Tax=Botryosphaeria parva (strain UCR-NP2) TaxID=1287680 RepID=R1GI53_BOTPV|nr:putative dna damage response protein [Neofusicoccum parvum UCRNP2]